MFEESGVLALIAIAVIVGIGVWQLNLGSLTFFVKISDGVAVARRGKVTAAFLEHVAELCGEFRVNSGWVGGVRRRKQIRLVCSRSLPKGMQQRLRNAWPFLH